MQNENCDDKILLVASTHEHVIAVLCMLFKNSYHHQKPVMFMFVVI